MAKEFWEHCGLVQLPLLGVLGSGCKLYVYVSDAYAFTPHSTYGATVLAVKSVFVNYVSSFFGF